MYVYVYTAVYCGLYVAVF